MDLPIILGWKPKDSIRIDLLPKLEGECVFHVHLSEGENKGHIKLEYGNTPYCLSLFVFNKTKFFNNQEVRVRSYDLWDKKIMYAARLPNGRLHPKNPGFIYREDAIIEDEGRYILDPPIIQFFWKNHGNLKFKIKFLGKKRYFSKKYGYSVRSEYLFVPLE